MTYRSKYRAVWRNDFNQAHTLMIKSKVAKYHLSVSVGDGESERSPPHVQHILRSQSSPAKKHVLEQEASSARPFAKPSSRSTTTQRLVKLWSLFGKRLIIKGIGIPQSDGNICIVRSPEQREQELSAHKSKTFSYHPIDSEVAARFLRAEISRWTSWSISFPPKTDIRPAAARDNNAACGPDGIPPSTWCTGEGVDMLHSDAAGLWPRQSRRFQRAILSLSA